MADEVGNPEEVVTHPPLVTLRDVNDGYRRRTVFDALSLDIPHGITVLLGPNGAGKSTLLNLIAGVRAPRAGSITVASAVVSSDRDRHREAAGDDAAREVRSSLLPQSFGYLRSYTVSEFVRYVAWLQQVPKNLRRSQSDESIKSVGLWERRDDKMRTLSGGMIQRAGIAAALVAQPELLLLDEPAAGLDPVQRIELQRVLTRLAPATSTLLSTHLAEDVEDFAAAVLIIDKGELLYSGTPSALIETCALASASPVSTVTQAYLALMRQRGGG